jgi:hypothetical protein
VRNLADYKQMSIRATGLSEKSKNISALFMLEKAQHWKSFEDTLAKVSNAKSRADLKKDFDQQHADWIREHRKKTNSTRWAYLKELQELREESGRLVRLWESPQVVATLENVGSQERSRYLEQIKTLGPASLASLAMKAEMESNRALASALISVNDALPTDKRPFSSQELASAVFKADVDAAKEAHLQIARAQELAMAENRKCEGFGENAVTRLGRSIRFKDVPEHKIANIDDYDLGIGPSA